MAEQLLKEGDIVEHGEIKLECTFVTWRDIDGERENFTYSFRPHDEMERERKETTIPDVNEEKGE